MTRKCSHCGHNGHNSRTCPNRGVKFFGVRLTDGPIRKRIPNCRDFYLSGLEKNSGVPWTEEEHHMFLIGLQKLGKGDWRGISRNFVPTRSPTQVASHAQKYFIRPSNLTRRKRHSSLFDITDEPISCPLPSLALPVFSSQSASDQEEANSGDNSTNSGDVETLLPQVDETAFADMTVFPGFVTPYVPYGFPIWHTFRPTISQNSNVYKPTVVMPTAPIKIDECTWLSQLSLGGDAAASAMKPSELSLKLHGRSSRQSSFQANPSLN